MSSVDCHTLKRTTICRFCYRQIGNKQDNSRNQHKLGSVVPQPFTAKVQDKIIWTFDLIEELQRIPETYFKNIADTDGLYEIRIQLGSDIFRIFCFFDQGQLVVLANGYQKKSQKTPKQEIEKALKIKKEYENEKR